MTQATDRERAVSQKAVEALRAGLGERLVAVVLFGSQACGDHRLESDWDLLVIAKGLPEHPWDPWDRRMLLDRPLFGCRSSQCH